MNTTKVAFHWSGGKDSALALQILQQDASVDVVQLLTTINLDRGDSVVHGIPVDLLETQAASLGIPLRPIALPGSSWEGYLDLMEQTARRCKSEGIDAFGFGDLQRSEMRARKVAQFAPLGIDVVTPLWDMTSAECASAFMASGIQAQTVVVDARVLDVSFVGRQLDPEFFADLPPDVDPCGELGEYHTFAFDGPCFRGPVAFSLAEPEFLERQINTTSGQETFSYWVATPRQSTPKLSPLQPDSPVLV